MNLHLPRSAISLPWILLMDGRCYPTGPTGNRRALGQYQQNRASDQRSKDHGETMVLCRIQNEFDEARDENHAANEDAAMLDGLAKGDYRVCYAIAILITPIADVELLDCVSIAVMTAALISSFHAFPHRATLSTRQFVRSKALEEGSQPGHATNR